MQHEALIIKRPRRTTMRDVRQFYKRQKETTAKARDPSDLAFFVIGFMRDFDGVPRNFDGGQYEFVSSAIEYVSLLNVPLPDDFAGMFAYDIAEEFGALVCKHMQAGTVDVQMFKDTLIAWIEKECTP